MTHNIIELRKKAMKILINHMSLFDITLVFGDTSENIKEIIYGPDEIICLDIDTLYRNALRRHNVCKINDLKDMMESGEIDKIRHIGKVGKRQIKKALEDYERNEHNE